MTPEKHDPEATVWRAVAELERKHFTKEEIAEALYQVDVQLSHEHLHR